MKKIRLINIHCNNLTSGELLKEVSQKIRERTQAYMVFVNVDVMVKAEKDTYLRKIINKADFSMVDGMPLVWISRFYRRPVKEKVSGSDFVPLLCHKAAEEKWSIFLLGGEDGVTEKAGKKLTAMNPGLVLAGMYSPPRGFEQNPQELEAIKTRIRNAAPDILVVCFGCPKQEKFIYEHYADYGAPLSICAGATMDFLAEKIQRCPVWVSRVGLEWFYRFLKEPKRLFRRYFIEDPVILWLAYKYRPDRAATNVCGNSKSVQNNRG